MANDFSAKINNMCLLMKRYLIIFLLFNLVACGAAPAAELFFPDAPTLNPNYTVLDSRNRQALFSRLIAASSQYYNSNFSLSRNFASDFSVYYLRQELQAQIDLYYATNNVEYLDRAETLVQKAISDSNNNKRTLLYYGQDRGLWPCFLLNSVIQQTGGHNQIIDFQGAAGFMMVASALKEAGLNGWQEIATFVEENIIEKWLFYNPNINEEDYQNDLSIQYMLSALNTARDKREFFASLCLDLDALGFSKYPYKKWGEFLIKVYLSERNSISDPFHDAEFRDIVPSDWGLIVQENDTLVWYWGDSKFTMLDTSHANRTVWLSVKAYKIGLIPKSTIIHLINTFKQNIFAAEKGAFYFNNMIDGSDPIVQNIGPGRKGNLWFGWHRLAAYDHSLSDLFVSLAYELTNGGTLIDSQNKTMLNAPLCLMAWAARLVSLPPVTNLRVIRAR